MRDRMPDGFRQPALIGPPEEVEGEGPVQDQLRTAIREARGRLIDVLEAGQDPQQNDAYQWLEAEVTRLKAELGEPQ
jgi:hypothetical protein